MACLSIFNSTLERKKKPKETLFIHKDIQKSLIFFFKKVYFQYLFLLGVRLYKVALYVDGSDLCRNANHHFPRFMHI